MAQGKAPKTVAVEINILRTVLNVARRQGTILTNPAEAVELPKVVSHTHLELQPLKQAIATLPSVLNGKS